MNVYVWTNTMENAYIGEFVPFTPWANTIAYYPLTSSTTTQDKSWNNRNLTNNWTQFGTYAGVNCAYFSNSQSKKLYWNLPLTWNSAFTINVWLYRLWYVDVVWSQIFLLWPINTAGYCLGLSLEWNTWEYKYYTWGSDQKTSLVCPTNKWEMVTLTNDTSKVHLYVNGTLIKEWALTFNVNTTDFTIWAWNVIRNSNYQPFYWYMSELIAESAVWTANQIQWYYNNTKSNYWL